MVHVSRAIGMPILPLRLAPLVLAATVALGGTATASVLVTVNKATQRMTVLVDGETGTPGRCRPG